MKRKLNWYVMFVMLCTTLVFVSCSKDSDLVNEGKPFISNFALKQGTNKFLTKDYFGEIKGDSLIVIQCPDMLSSDSIIPTFEGNYTSIQVNGEEQISGKSHQNFNNIVHYDIVGRDGSHVTYNVIIKVANLIPKIDIYTKDNMVISSKDDYVSATFKISNCPEFGQIEINGKIKGRGNATWGYPKKPYKIKFDNKLSLFGFPENKKWVLLAEACDRTLLRTAYMCEVSKAVGIDYTINYQYVDLYINKEYMGTYLFTDQVEKSQNRVPVNDDGFLIELDNYYKNEPLYFTTDSLKYGFSFKYPDADDGEILMNDDNYLFISDFMNNMEKSLFILSKDSTNTDYANYIDIESFAKWFLAAEITATYDPNKYFVLPSRTGKLKMMPLWDAEWSLGVWPTSAWGNPPEDMTKKVIWEPRYYFNFLFKSPGFRKAIKKEWDLFKEKITVVKEQIERNSEIIPLSQRDNFIKWPNNNFQPLNISFSSWEEEVEYINQFFDERISFLESHINDIDF